MRFTIITLALGIGALAMTNTLAAEDEPAPKKESETPAPDAPKDTPKPDAPKSDAPTTGEPKPSDTKEGAKKDGADKQGEGRRRGPPPSPLMQALDLNKDGVIDAAEIAKAATSLMTLDKNKDGSLAGDEISPPRRERGRRGERGGRGGDMKSRLLQYDEDGDGKVSRDEAPERMAAFFDRMDEDGDGFIDEAEMDAMSERFRGGGGGGGR